MSNTYKVKVILQIEAENYDDAEEKVMFAINESLAYLNSIEILEETINGK